jgi:hypothetical protein
VLRTFFSNADCEALFFDAAGQLRPRTYFLEIGRQAMRALLDPDNQAIDALRSQILDDAIWPTAIVTGANVNLGPLVGIGTDDPRVSLLIGDVYVISEWAHTMVQSGASVQEMRALVGNGDPATLMGNNQFKSRRDQLQKSLASMAKASKTRFDEPWGMVSLFWASGASSGAYGKTVTQALTLELGNPTMQLKP